MGKAQLMLAKWQVTGVSAQNVILVTFGDSKQWSGTPQREKCYAKRWKTTRRSPRVQHGTVLKDHETNAEVPKQIHIHSTNSTSTSSTRTNSTNSTGGCQPTLGRRVHFHAVNRKCPRLDHVHGFGGGVEGGRVGVVKQKRWGVFEENIAASVLHRGYSHRGGGQCGQGE